MTSLWTVCSRGRYRALGVTILALTLTGAAQAADPSRPGHDGGRRNLGGASPSLRRPRAPFGRGPLPFGRAARAG